MDSLAVMACRKHRRAPPSEQVVFHIDGALSILRSTEGKYKVDPQTRKIVETRQLNKIRDKRTSAIDLGETDSIRNRGSLQRGS